MNEKVALIAGASGLVGSELLQILLNGEAYDKVYAVSRKPLEIDHPKLIEVVCDFDNLEEIQGDYVVDDVFCCLGTTIKKAKTKEVMYKVDVEYPISLANITREMGAKHYLLISSMNANPSSPIWYPKMKGELEEELKRIRFTTTSIFRPALLLGNRKEFRLGEDIASKLFKGVSSLFKGSWKSRFAIEASSVAKGMYEVAQMDKTGVTIYASTTIEDIANKIHNER
ncbi:NAD-dependent epimerase/dehydratase family protein [Bacillus sp. FJAT-45350]|uniref:NAD-dependent epimerase/dehydratase family protein n=1 Tax=Bacillus sp. FJAT-45350 TaxID=2011014 RepID=UPI000BB9190E|nr:NAD-dependent epimerase/dehydratase family protein [Bacillus sp. FJAT-45350]